jgi:type I pantothenate kinase
VHPSPWVTLERAAWATLRSHTPLTLTEDDLARLRGINEDISLDEVAEVYLPLSRLLNLYVAATQELHRATDTFLGSLTAKVPLRDRDRGLGGRGQVDHLPDPAGAAVAVARPPGGRAGHHRRVPAAQRRARARGLMERKGFPESYDTRLVRFVAAVKAGEAEVRAPVYSHLTYDVVPDEKVVSAGPTS